MTRLAKKQVIEKLTGEPLIVERLTELGFLPGEYVEIVSKSPFGEPIVVRVRNMSVALRKEELKCLVLKG